MAKTGHHLEIKSMGEDVLGVELKGNPDQPEPIHFRVSFPGGDVDIVRTTDNQYWAHFRVNRPDDGDEPDRVFGRLVDARIDCRDKHASQCDIGDFNRDDLYHVAFKVTRDD